VSDGQLHLFDTRLGLPIPGPGGRGVATLHDLQTDASLLRQLDVEGAAYPVSSDQLQHVTAGVVADWFDLSRRAKLLEERLSGDDRLALTASPAGLVGRLQAMPGIVEVRLWELPYGMLDEQLNFGHRDRRRAAQDFEPFAQRPTLWKARVLHFRGQKNKADKTTDEIIDDHRLARQAYLSPSVRPPIRVLDGITSAPQRKIYETAKDDAAYWVGLLAYDDGNYATAEDWLKRRELQASDGPWTDGAHYNLARTYEQEGKLDEAIALLRQDASPQRAGNLLRARMLEAGAKAEKDSGQQKTGEP
jgi:tetratricopeptide (TPR) repeat protein